MNQTEFDVKWMNVALEEARQAVAAGEIPVGVVIVGGDTELIRGQTKVARQESMVAHGELLALQNLGWRFRWAERPLRLYSTLEPCWMCAGAAMQCEVDEIIFAVPAKPDGGTKYLSAIANTGYKVPAVRGRVLEQEVVELMRQTLANAQTSPDGLYLQEVLAGL